MVSKSESSLILASTSHQDRVFRRDSQQAGKKASYNVFAYSSGRLHKSIREKTVAVRGLCACWQGTNR